MCSEAVFLDTLKSHMVEGAEAGSVDLVLRNEHGFGNMHLVQMTYRGTFEASSSMLCNEEQSADLF